MDAERYDAPARGYAARSLRSSTFTHHWVMVNDWAEVTLKMSNAVLTVLRASVVGAGTILLVTLLGYAVGLLIEARIGRPVVSFELVPLGVWFSATLAGILVAIAGAVSGSWRRGLAIGLLIHGLLFGGMAFGYFLLSLSINRPILSDPSGYPFAVNCWILAVGTVGGSAAGAMGGALRHLQLKENQQSVEARRPTT